MKKIFLLSVLSLIISASAASAKNGAYVGIDFLEARTKHIYKPMDSSAYFTKDFASNTRDKSNGFGINAGYKFNIASSKAFVAPEIFYEYINNKAEDFFAGFDPGTSGLDTLTIKDRFGAKVNLGYEVNEKFSLFVNAGVTKVKYGVHFKNKSAVTYETAMIYGLGASYNITNNVALKLSYDKQNFNAKYFYEGSRDTIRLNVLKVGVAYNF